MANKIYKPKDLEPHSPLFKIYGLLDVSTEIASIKVRVPNTDKMIFETHYQDVIINLN